MDLCIQPFFTFFQLLFYLGWLKVAESLVNPFGEDEDDLEINALIDRNVKISNLIVDDLHAEHPDLTEDDGPERFTWHGIKALMSSAVLYSVGRMVGHAISEFLRSLMIFETFQVDSQGQELATFSSEED